ncbi:hypothetical protein [Neoroseomonas soli]|uniref:Uncharacterized protein n=1 Tax=Neoroseomonas soli TaxID=1081025 RepID=A0A9X9WYS6_9PROT|nr:hypothetical protein [Neoroseomonas soli]MBR0672305.1 hypothetical protein [Neoroseomonas soli]
MSGTSGKFFFGAGNRAFYNLLRPMGGGGFAKGFGKALTFASTGTAAFGIFNQVQDYREGRNSGQEAAFGSAALFFGCLGGGGSLKAFAYSGLTSYLVMASLIGRRDHFRATNPDAQFVPEALIKTSDYFDLMSPLPMAVAEGVSGSTGGRGGMVLKTLGLGYSMLNLDLGNIKRLCLQDGAEIDHMERVEPEMLPLHLANYGDQALSDVEIFMLLASD